MLLANTVTGMVEDVSFSYHPIALVTSNPKSQRFLAHFCRGNMIRWTWVHPSLPVSFGILYRTPDIIFYNMLHRSCARVSDRVQSGKQLIYGRTGCRSHLSLKKQEIVACVAIKNINEKQFRTRPSSPLIIYYQVGTSVKVRPALHTFKLCFAANFDRNHLAFNRCLPM